ncbi:MAG: glycosyltransferase family 39 protein [Sphingomonadales bacterium]
MTTLFPLRADSKRALPDPLLVAAALLLVLVMPNPAGYVGGGGDDFYYVQAARCVALHGWCVPETHWAARWPLVAPMGAAFAIFGDGRWQGALVPFGYSLMALLFFVRIVEDVWGRATALVGGIAFVATASFAKGLLQPNVETIELAWIMAAAWAGRRAMVATARPVLWAAVAGICLGLAIQTRMTSLAWLPILGIGVFLFPGRHRHLALPALLGTAIPIGADMLINWHIAGDALLSQHLSIAHTRIASSELPAWVDRSRSPLFNPQFIAGWAPAVCIHTHWTIQGVVNLLLNPQMGPVLLAASLLLFLARKTLTWRSPEALLAGAALLYTGALIYALAIDPKARMFLPTAALAAALVGRLGVVLWHSGERVLVGIMLAGLVTVGTIETAKRFDMGKAGPLAARWANEHKGDVAVEDATRRFLTFDATVRGLPVWPAGTSRVLVLIAGECASSPVAKTSGPLVRSAYFGRKNDPLNLCEFRRVGPAELTHP